ncbi:MAG: contractile injection system tape measure protein, partial [Methylobacter sp.]
MGTQRHVIQRQIVEITLAKKETAWELQQALSRIFQQRFPPLLDRCLSEVSSPDYLHRIDRLELDLGELDIHRLDNDILDRIEQSLRQALHEQIDGMAWSVSLQNNGSMLSHLELFEHFVREGYLPWWADNSQRQLPEK